MKVFISWSGIRSRFIAETLRGWLPKVIQSIRPWMSEEDISAGSRWSNDVSKELSQSNFGIICVTPENQSNPWLLFEAGALSKTIEESYVCPILFDMPPSQLLGPLSQFQATQIDANGTLRLLSTMNKALGETQLPNDDLDEIFKVWWPRLEDRLVATPTSDDRPQARRSADDLLAEILENTREQLRRENLRVEHSKDKDARLDSLLDMMQSSMSALKHIQRVPQVLSRIAEGPAASSIDDKALGHLLQSIPSMDPEAMKNLFAQLQEMKARDQKFTDELLNGPSDGDHPVRGDG